MKGEVSIFTRKKFYGGKGGGFQTYIQSYRHQICDFEMCVNEMLAIVVLYYN